MAAMPVGADAVAVTAVGDQARDHEPPPPGDGAEQAVTQPVDHRCETARGDEEEEEHPDATGEHLQVAEADRGPDVAQPLVVDGAEERAGQRGEPADDDEDEHLEAGEHPEGGAVDRLLLVGEQRPRDRGDEAADREGGEPRAGGARPHRLGRGEVVAHRDEGAAGVAGAQGTRAEPGEREAAEADVVEGRVPADVDGAVEDRPADGDVEPGQQPGGVLPVEHEVLHGDREGEGHHREKEALDAQRRQADEQRGDGAGEPGGEQGDEEVLVVVDGEAAGDRRADPAEGELAE